MLEGFDWERHTLSVLLIEVYQRFEKTYSRFLSARGLVRLTDFTSPTGLNQVWYNASLVRPIAPRALGKQARSSQGAAKREKRHYAAVEKGRGTGRGTARGNGRSRGRSKGSGRGGK